MNFSNPILLILSSLLCLHFESPTPDSEFIFDSASYPSCHASTIVELPNGDLLSAWFGGTEEGNPDVAIWGSRKTNGKWSTPVEIIREKETPCWNPVYFMGADHRLWFYYKYGTSPMTWSAGRKYSDDNGLSWSEIEHLPAGILGPIRAKPLVLKNGVIVSGSSVESYGTWSVWIERSSDNGKSFTKIGPITVAENLMDINATRALMGNKRSIGIIQPSIVQISKKHLRMYARSTTNIGKVCVADSYDEGKKWTPARPLNIPNPNSGLDAIRLNDGRVVLIYNNTSTGRTPLNLAASDNGENFKMFYTLENAPGEYSYPNIIQGKNGDLHITYTWNRTHIKYVHFKLTDIP